MQLNSTSLPACTTHLSSPAQGFLVVADTGDPRVVQQRGAKNQCPIRQTLIFWIWELVILVTSDRKTNSNKVSQRDWKNSGVRISHRGEIIGLKLGLKKTGNNSLFLCLILISAHTGISASFSLWPSFFLMARDTMSGSS